MRAGRNVDPDTVADILAHAEWPAERLWLVVERWQPAAEVQDKANILTAAGVLRLANTQSPFAGRLPVAAGIFGAGQSEGSRELVLAVSRPLAPGSQRSIGYDYYRGPLLSRHVCTKEIRQDRVPSAFA